MNIDEVKKIFEVGLSNRVLVSGLQPCNMQKAVDLIESWKKQGYKVIFTAGVFDIFTINHLLALYHYKIMGGAKSKLVISIDTDQRVLETKSFSEDKGNSIKPILSWSSRALMIAKQSFLDKEPLVDLILQHGEDTCDGMRCSHDDNVYIAEIIRPDYVVVTSTSTDTINKLKASKIINSNNLVIIDEEKLAYDDPLLGGKISNTSIIKRVKYGN